MTAITPDGGSKRAVVCSFASQPVGEGQEVKFLKEWCKQFSKLCDFHG